MKKASTKQAKPRAAAQPKTPKITEAAPKATLTAEGSATRLPNGCFRKGYSANPGGMMKGVAEAKKLARQYTNEAVMCLVDIMQDKSKPAPARVSAATALLDRGYGKPTQQIEVGKPGDFSEMTEAQIDAFIAKAGTDLAHLNAEGFAVH